MLKESDLAEIRRFNPCLNVRLIHYTKIYANDYNPNIVAPKELELLYISIKNDGYTMPVVVCPDGNGRFVIVDGYHRYFVMQKYKDIQERNKGYLPCTVLDKNLAERMAATIRHNRARGAHLVAGDANVILRLKKQGKTDKEIIKELGFGEEEYKKKCGVYRINDLVKNHVYSISKDDENNV